jgi:effector-binding domain-containing protein
MQIIKTAPISFIYFQEETTVGSLKKFLPVGQELFREATRANIPVTGPVHWHYHGFTIDPAKRFVLEVCLPVGEIPAEYDGVFNLKRTDSFPCVCEFHSGSWYDLPGTYKRMMEFVSAAGLLLSDQTRELYVNVDLADPDANLTVVQIGIQP